MHPLSQLSRDEFITSREIVVNAHGSDVTLFFKAIYLDEPRKEELVQFLKIEHEGSLTDATPRPKRCAKVEYLVVTEKDHEYTSSVVDLDAKEVVSSTSCDKKGHPYFSV